MLIRQTALKTALLATTADTVRNYALHAVNVRPDGVVEATDGHILIRVTDQAPIASEDFPAVPGAAAPLEPSDKGILIGADQCKKLIGAMPRKTTIDVLHTVNVGTVDSKPYAIATDLDTPCIVALEKTNEGATFPATDRVMVQDGDRTGVIRVRLRADVIRILADMAKEVGGKHGTLTLEIPTEAKYLGTKDPQAVVCAIRYSATGTDLRADGVVMPCAA